jgi:predicted RNA-binding Zn-ribbon protein involved in translation (DUF1610 family)|tara:strand:- start:598 stop:888 length:291 start_codon:yes stop_codon:yes gene_type:complete
MSRFSQAWDFIQRDTLPDRSEWDRIYDSIYEFSDLVRLRNEYRDEHHRMPSDFSAGGDIAVCSVCNYKMDVSRYERGERTACPLCGESLTVYKWTT